MSFNTIVTVRKILLWLIALTRFHMNTLLIMEKIILFTTDSTPFNAPYSTFYSKPMFLPCNVVITLDSIILLFLWPEYLFIKTQFPIRALVHEVITTYISTMFLLFGIAPVIVLAVVVQCVYAKRLCISMSILVKMKIFTVERFD